MSVEGCPLSRLPAHVVEGGPSAIIQVGGAEEAGHEGWVWIVSSLEMYSIVMFW